MKRILLALSATCLATVVAAPAAAEAPALYSVRDTVVGTQIPQAIITSAVPFDKTYAQMSAEQRAIIAQDYESLAPGDEPPYPAFGLNHLSPYMMRLAELKGTSGPLVATVDVGPDGQARTVTVYKSPDADLTSMVTTLLARETYKPAICGGAPCAMTYVMRVNFPERHGQHVTHQVPGDYRFGHGM